MATLVMRVPGLLTPFWPRVVVVRHPLTVARGLVEWSSVWCCLGVFDITDSAIPVTRI